jgi:NADH-quinone oxidoreductase subunit C
MADEKTTLLGLAAVREGLAEHPAVKALGELIADAKFDRGELTLTVTKENIVPALKAVKAAEYNAFQDMTAVDWFPSVPRFQLTYHIQSHSLKELLRVCAPVDEADASIETITHIWEGANYYEREVFDLFGIRFDGHPNLRRIMMPDEWVGHPLRKDYPVEGYR